MSRADLPLAKPLVSESGKHTPASMAMVSKCLSINQNVKSDFMHSQFKEVYFVITHLCANFWLLALLIYQFLK